MSAAFMVGAVDSLGWYLVPLMDKEKFLGIIFFYLILMFGILALIRGFIFDPLLGIIDITELKETHQGKILLNAIIAITFVYFIAITALVVIISLIQEIDTLNFDSRILGFIYFAVIMLSIFLVLWYFRRKNYFLLTCIGLSLYLSYLIGYQFASFHKLHDADFELQVADSAEKYNVNIVFESTNGILTINKSTNLPEFFPWHQIKLVKTSQSRSIKEEKRREDRQRVPEDWRLKLYRVAIDQYQKLRCRLFVGEGCDRSATP
jgi:hypothetical protein